MPRRVVPGVSYALNRRCLDRRFYLRPSEDLNDIYLYALAHAQQKYDMGIHAFVAMSNHPHENVTDPHGVLPDFMRDLRRDIALGAKQLYRIPSNLWTAAKPSAVEQKSAKAEHEKIVYTILNPVRAGLVERAADWPGAISLPGVREIEVRRPGVWFGEDRPEVLTLRITPPPSFEGTEDQWHAWLAAEVAKGEEELRCDREKRKVRVLGKQRILRQHPFDRPRTLDDLRPGRNPTIATGGDGALMRAAIRDLREWRRAYRSALERWRVDKTVGFPLGTWWVVQRAGAALA